MVLRQDGLAEITIGGMVFNYACPRQTNACVRRRVVFNRPIHRETMLHAMELTRQRYPQLSLGMEKSKQYVMERHIDAPFKLNRIAEGFSRIGADTNGHMIAFYAEGNTLYVDFFHAIADDAGMDRFIQTLLHAYLTLSGYRLDSNNGRIITYDSPYDPREGEDAGAQLLALDVHERPDAQPRRAFKIRGRRRPLNAPEFAYTVQVDLKNFKAYAKSRGASPTALVSTLFSRILYRHYSADILKSANPITAEVAVNLRKHFPTESVRSFVGNVYLTYGWTSDRAELEDVLGEQTASLRAQNTPESQAAFYSHALRLADRWFNESTLPVYAKNWIHKHIAVKAMSGGMTYGISNIGKEQLPDCLKPHIAEYHTMVPSGLHAYLICMRSEGDTLTLCITSKLLDSADVVAQMVELLRRNGMDARLTRTEDFYYTQFVQNLAVTPAHRSRIDLSPAMDRVLAGIEHVSIAGRRVNIAVRSLLA